MMRDTSLIALAESLVAYGTRRGADQVEVAIRSGSNFSAQVREGELETLVEAGFREASVKLIVDQKVATEASSDLSKETLNGLIDNGIGRARLSGADAFAGLPELEKVTVRPEALGIFDEAVAEMSPESKIAAARRAEAVCLSDKRIRRSMGSRFGTSVETLYLANSNGFSDAFAQTACSNGVYLQVGEPDNLISEGKYDYSRNLAGLMSPAEIGAEAISRSTRLIGARKVPTQSVPVVLESEMTAELLRFLASCLEGRSVYRKQSFLADRIGDRVAGTNVNVWDDGLMPGAPGAKPFDREGVPLRKTAVIEKGVLKSYLLDSYSGRKLGMKPTGNASGPNNLYLSAGDTSPADIVGSVDKGLLLTGTIGFGAVPTTGDISRGAFGIWIEGGEPAYPVAGVTIGANLGTLLQQVEMIGNDLDHRRYVNGPTIKVAEMTVGGT